MCVFALKGFKEERLRGFACCQLGQLQTPRPAGSHALPITAARSRREQQSQRTEHSRQYWWELQLEAGNTGAKLRRRGTEPCPLHPSVLDPWQPQFSRACWPEKRMSFPSS